MNERDGGVARTCERPLRLLVTGATGCVGSAVLDRAAADEATEVWALTRSGRLGRAGPAHPVRGTLAELPSLLGDLPAFDACIHAAAAVHGQERDPVAVFATNVDASLRVAEALAKRGGLRRFVFVSTVAAGARAGAPDETHYARSKAEAERRLVEVAAAGGFEAPVIRLATVYGPGDRGNLAALYRAIRTGRYVRLAPLDTRKSLVWVGSAAAALLAAADPAVDAPPLSVLADARPYLVSEIEDALAAVAGVPPPRRLWAPIGVGAAAAGSIYELALRRPAPLTLARLRTLRRSAAFVPGPHSEILEVAMRHAVGLEAGFARSYSSHATTS